jgi:hypothetical protein
VDDGVCEAVGEGVTVKWEVRVGRRVKIGVVVGGDVTVGFAKVQPKQSALKRRTA